MRACDPHARAVHADAPAGCCFLRKDEDGAIIKLAPAKTSALSVSEALDVQHLQGNEGRERSHLMSGQTQQSRGRLQERSRGRQRLRMGSGGAIVTEKSGSGDRANGDSLAGSVQFSTCSAGKGPLCGGVNPFSADDNRRRISTRSTTLLEP